jgi:hypothetical protein
LIRKRVPREFRDVKPELLNLAPALDVVGEQTAGDTKVLVRDVPVGPDEPNEEPHHVRIGIRELQLVSVFRSLCPVQHATARRQSAAQSP